MRSARQISRTSRAWAEFQEAERRRHLAAVLAELRRAREAQEPWYLWVVEHARRRRK